MQAQATNDVLYRQLKFAKKKVITECSEIAVENGHVNPDSYFLENIQMDEEVTNLLFLESEGFSAKYIISINDSQILNYKYKEASTLKPQVILDYYWDNSPGKKIIFSLDIGKKIKEVSGELKNSK